MGLIVGAAITGGMAIGALIWNSIRETRPASQLPMRFALALPPAGDMGSVVWENPALALSPDGSDLVFVAAREATTQLFLRRIGQLDVFPIAGTEGATGPFFSPDGAWVGFFFWKAADGSGSPELLLRSDNPKCPSSVSPDGQLLAFTEMHPTTRADIWLLPFQGERKPRPFLQTQFEQWSR